MKQHYAIFQSPLFLFALLILLVNDFYLKQHFPGFISGKLSDVAGLFIFPLFISAFLPDHRDHIYLFTGISFIFWKSPLSEGLIQAWNDVQLIHIGRVIDYTDLFALAVLPLAYQYQRTSHHNIQVSKPLVICLAAFSFLATSKKDPELNCQLHETYFVPAVSRDSLIAEVKRMNYDIHFYIDTDDRYPDQNFSITNLVDSNTTYLVTIYNYDYDSMAVKLILNAVIEDGYIAPDKTKKRCDDLTTDFENRIVNRLAFD